MGVQMIGLEDVVAFYPFMTSKSAEPLYQEPEDAHIVPMEWIVFSEHLTVQNLSTLKRSKHMADTEERKPSCYYASFT